MKSPADYATAAQTHAFVARGRSGSRARLAAEDMMAAGAFAELAGTSLATVHSWIDTGRAIGLRQSQRVFRMPAWQFQPRIWEAVPKISAALNSKDGWSLLAFLESPLGALGGLTPRTAIEQGQLERVIFLATHDATS